MPVAVIWGRTEATTLGSQRSHAAVTQGEMQCNGGGAREAAARPACRSGMMDEPIPCLVISADWL